MKIHERIHVVGGGDNSFGLSHPLDCTVYLIDGGESLALVDAGAGMEPERILRRVEEAGFSPAKVDSLLLTHAHADHCGGAAYLAQACGATVYAAVDAAAFLRARSLDALSLPAAVESGVYPREYLEQFSFCEPCSLPDGGMVRVGDLVLTMLELPGHSDGHCGYLLEFQNRKILFSGDLAFGKAKISMQKTWDCRFQPYLDSLRRVQTLQIDSLLTGHQAFCLDGASRIFDRLLSKASVMPANL